MTIIAHSNDVKCRGNPLGAIWWQGRQWAVTSDGLEARDGTYFIDASRLREELDSACDHSWIAHVCDKNWVDGADFSTAYFIACAMHNVRLSKDQVRKLIRHAAKAREDA
jgi:hypothetical protein